MYTLHKKTVVKTTLDEAWAFIKNPANLNAITPDDMNFEIMTHVPEEMTNGMLIEYRVDLPLLGRRKWVSEIKDIVPLHSFVDEQTTGPYKYWHHHHVIEPVEEGVLFTDRISYTPPFGAIGKLGNAVFIHKKLENIFSYRGERLNEILGCKGHAGP